MVNSNSGKSIHDETQGYESSPQVEEVGLDSNRFEHDLNQADETEEVSPDRSGYGLRERGY